MRLILGSHSAVGVADAESGDVIVRHELVSPTYVAVASDGEHLYAVSEDPAGEGRVFVLNGADPSQALRSFGGRAALPSGGDGPCHVSLHPDGEHLLVSHYMSGSLAVLPVAGGEPRVVQHFGSGPDMGRQAAPHVHQAVTDPSGQWILACDLGTDEVVVYRLDNGRPRRHTHATFKPGQGVRHLAFAPSGRRVYVAAELSSQLVVCDWDPDAGSLSPGKAVATTTDRPADDAGGLDAVRNYPGAVVVSDAGNHVYVTNRGDDSIAVIDTAVDTLAATLSSGGKWPRDACLSPDGRRLFVANEHSGTVTAFAVDNGIPVATGPVIDFPGVTSVTPG